MINTIAKIRKIKTSRVESFVLFFEFADVPGLSNSYDPASRFLVRSFFSFRGTKWLVYFKMCNAYGMWYNSFVDICLDI